MGDTRKPTRVIITLKKDEKDYLLKLVQDKNNVCGFTYRLVKKLSNPIPNTIPYKALLQLLEYHNITSVEELASRLAEPKREDE